MYPVKDRCEGIQVNVAVNDEPFGNSGLSQNPTENKTAWIGLSIVSALGAIWCAQILPLGSAVILISGLSVISLIALSKILFDSCDNDRCSFTISNSKTEGVWAWLPFPNRGFYHPQLPARSPNRYIIEKRRSLPNVILKRPEWHSLEHRELPAVPHAIFKKDQRASVPNQRSAAPNIEKQTVQNHVNRPKENFHPTFHRYDKLREFEKIRERERMMERREPRERFERRGEMPRAREFMDRERIVPRLE